MKIEDLLNEKMHSIYLKDIYVGKWGKACKLICVTDDGNTKTEYIIEFKECRHIYIDVLADASDDSEEFSDVVGISMENKDNDNDYARYNKLMITSIFYEFCVYYLNYKIEKVQKFN